MMKHFYVIIKQMKKFLVILLSLFSLSLYGQEYTTTKLETNVVSTSKMIWNYTTNKWDFVDNNDVRTFKSLWVFTINNESKGMISNGNIDYDILEYNYVDETAVYFQVWNTKVLRRMTIVLYKKELEISVAVFDNQERIAYFFLP